MGENDFNLLEEKIGQSLPKELFQILEIYSGMSINENKYIDIELKEWTLGKFSTFPYIYKYIDQIDEELQLAKLDMKLLPFANEIGGWLFCVSVESKFPVYIFKTTDYNGRNAIHKISNSFTEFINGLKISE